MSRPTQAASQRPQLVPTDRLDSWKEISAYLGRGERTVQRWEREQGLPVHRLAHNKQSSVYAFKPELDVWWQNRRPSLESGEPVQAPPRRRLRWYGLAAAVVLSLAAAAVWFLRPEAPSQPDWRTQPITTYPGMEAYPAISPDGRQLAFVWDGERRDNYDIYVQSLDGGAPTRLTNSAAREISPAWSPDGRHIAFLRLGTIGSPDDLVLVPAIGGPERKLAQVMVLVSQTWGHPPVLAWTRDGKHIAVGSYAVEAAHAAIVLVSTETGQTKPLIGGERKETGSQKAPPQRDQGPAYYITPAFSPDGKWLAYTRCWSYRDCDLYAVPLSPSGEPQGQPSRLSLGERFVNSPVWAPSGRELFFSAGAPWEGRGLWRVAVNGVRRSPRQVHPAADMQGISVAPKGDALVYSRETFDGDIWGFDLDSPTGKATKPRKIVASTRLDYCPEFSPDGSRIAFTSNRSGNPEIWVAGRDGGNPTRLTSSGAYRSYHPSWSPDGKRIAFTRQDSRGSAICVTRSSGGPPDCLTDGKGFDSVPSWSRDGGFLYFLSHRSGSLQLWKMAAAGESMTPAVQLTKKGAVSPASESWDGKYVYYSTVDSGLWRMPSAGGEEERVPGLDTHGHAMAVRDGLFYLSVVDLKVGTLLFLPDGKTRPVKVAELELPYGAFSVTQDGRSVLFAMIERSEGDLVLIENFR